MKWSLALLAVVAALGCPQPITGGTSGFVGANAFALVDLVDAGVVADGGTNQFLVVTSTNTSELRVLDLKSSFATGAAATHEPLRAPNPLETLSIPVLDRPTALSLDARYVEGVRVKGSLLYAIRQGGAELSIVSMDLTELREVRRVSVSAPITAITTLMKDAATSRVWVATFDGVRSTVLELTIPATAAELRKVPTASLSGALATRVQIAGESVTALLAVPGVANRTLDGKPFCADPSQACLVVATRGLAGALGSTTLVDPVSLASARLDFPGPVRQLAISDRAVEGRPESVPGAWIYGVLEEEACGTSSCGGVAVVDARGAARAGGVFASLDREPFRGLRDGLVRSLTLSTDARVRNLSIDGGVDEAAMLGAVTRSNGEIAVFDALTLRAIDLDATTSALGGGSFGGDTTSWLEGPRIVQQTPAGAILAASIRDGAFRSQSISVVWRGTVGSVALPGDARASFVSRALAPHVRPGDAVTFAGGPCPASVVTAVQGDVIQFAPAASCGATAAIISASDVAPYVISGSVDGLLGRASSGTDFAFHGLVIPFGTAADTQPPATGLSWTFDLQASVTPLISVVDVTLFTTGTNCPSLLQLPGAMVFEPVRRRAFVAYPSSNTVVEFTPELLNAGPIGPNEGVICYR